MDIVLRATAMFFIVFALLRLLGKRELGQMTPFEVVSLVVMGDLIQQGITHNDFSLTGATLAIGTFAFWTVTLGWLVYLFPRLKRSLEGEPRVMTRSEVESEMRLAGIGSMRDVAWAILEPQGKISFIKKEKSDEPAAQQDDDAIA
jgi:uncharacterized membrane protein YcaP (DUF421 family)